MIDHYLDKKNQSRTFHFISKNVLFTIRNFLCVRYSLKILDIRWPLQKTYTSFYVLLLSIILQPPLFPYVFQIFSFCNFLHLSFSVPSPPSLLFLTRTKGTTEFITIFVTDHLINWLNHPSYQLIVWVNHAAYQVIIRVNHAIYWLIVWVNLPADRRSNHASIRKTSLLALPPLKVNHKLSSEKMLSIFGGR